MNPMQGLPAQVVSTEGAVVLGMGVQALQGQLINYAKDLQMLMEQHAKLQENYRMLLQSVGRPVPSGDQLPLALLDAVQIYLVSDEVGVIIQASSAAGAIFRRAGSTLRGKSVASLVVPAHRDMVGALLQKFDKAVGTGGIEQRVLSLTGQMPVKVQISFDLLAMQMLSEGRRQICWFFKQASPELRDPVVMQQRLLGDISGALGLMVTDPYGSIRYANSALCEMTDYAPPELLAQNPRLLGSGLHDTAFFQDFWLELLDRGQWSGEIFNRRKAGQIFLAWQTIRMVEDANNKVVSYVAALSDLSLREHPSDGGVSRLAYLDTLTGLPDRKLFEDRLARAVLEAAHEGGRLCVICLDLDHFKHINDEYGHLMGDQVLKEIGTRLKAALPSGDLVARVGGDEFLLLMHVNSSESEMESCALKILALVEQPLKLGEQTLLLTASMGCAVYPANGADPAGLLENADSAMYSAKLTRSNVQFFQAEIAKHPKIRMSNEIWHAVDRHEVDLLFQPQFYEHRKHRIRGCEVLLRWQHPVFGFVDPVVFIPVAEQSGAMVALGNWTLSKACHQLREWNSHGLQAFVMSVNVSLAQLRDPAFPGVVRQCLNESAITPSMLELDLTETKALSFESTDRPLIENLRQLGVRIAVSDSGAAFSCLTRLNNLKVNSLKMNPEVVQQIVQSTDAKAIANCMIALGDVMKMDVIATGVETAEQARVLNELGCPVVQGYFCGRPKSAGAFLPLALASKSSLSTAEASPPDTWHATLQ